MRRSGEPWVANRYRDRPRPKGSRFKLDRNPRSRWAAANSLLTALNCRISKHRSCEDSMSPDSQGGLDVTPLTTGAWTGRRWRTFSPRSVRMALEGPKHSWQSRSRRTQNWLALGLTYAAMYMARYNFPFANKSLSDQYGWTRAQIGGIITTATLLYGISALLNGPLADRFGGRRAMLIGATGACIFNLLFGLAAYMGFLGTGTLLLGYLATVW